VKMEIHSWDVDKDEAIRIQNELKGKVILRNKFDKIEKIGAVDCFYRDDEAKGAIVICDYSTLNQIEVKTVTAKVKFPYIPGLFAFREGPVIIELIKKVENHPDVLIIEGHGIAHPRRFGIASHIGVIIEKPTIGCAKKILYGNYTEPPSFPCSSTFIKDEEGEIIGHVLRNYQKGLLFISPGNMVDLKACLDIILHTLKEEYPLPYPLYLADKISKEEI